MSTAGGSGALSFWETFYFSKGDIVRFTIYLIAGVILFFFLRVKEAFRAVVVKLFDFKDPQTDTN